MEKQLKTKEAKSFFKTLASFSSDIEARKFMRDVCTFSELQSMIERWQVAKLLDKGMSYREISQKTGSSTTTITRVAHWLHHGEGGYRLMLDKK